MRMKLNPLRENIDGKRLVVVDDSIVRGTTQRAAGADAARGGRRRGAPAHHVAARTRGRASTAWTPATAASCSPPTSPSTRSASYLNVDSLAYLDARPAGRAPPARVGAGFCDACFTGDYPVEVAGRRCARACSSDATTASPPPRRATPSATSLLPADEACVAGRRRRRRRASRRSSPMGETYEAAGVDIAAGEEAVERIKAKVRSTFRPEVIGDIGGFGGLFAFDAHALPRPGARVVHRRRRHQGAGRPGRRPVRHHRHRPGGDVRRRHRVPGRRAAVLPRLHRGRQARPRPHRAARRGRGRGLPPGRLRARSAARWPSTRAPWSRASSTSSASRSASSSATASSPASTSRPATCSSACRRPACAPTATRWPAGCCFDVAGRSPRRPRLRGRRRTARRRAARAVGDLRARRSRRCSRDGRRARRRPHHRRRHPRQPAPGCCPTASTPQRRRARRGRRRGSSPRSSASARSTDDEMARCSTSASAWSSSSPPGDVARALEVLRAAGHAAAEVGRAGGDVARRGPGGAPRVTAPADTSTQALIDHLLQHAVRRGDFVLKSGKRSDWFIDAKQTTCRPDGMLLVADALLAVLPGGHHRHRWAHHGRRRGGVRHRGDRRHPGPAAAQLQRPQGGQGPRGGRPHRRRARARRPRRHHRGRRHPGRVDAGGGRGGARRGAEPVLLVPVVDRGGTCAAMAAEAGSRSSPLVTAPDLGFAYEKDVG